MTAPITFQGSTVEVAAEVVAKALSLTPEALRTGLREGAITTRVERGEGADEGRWRLTFFTPDRRLRLVVDAAGQVLQTSVADHRRRGVTSGRARDGQR